MTKTNNRFEVLIAINNVEQRKRIATGVRRIMKKSPFEAANADEALSILKGREFSLLVTANDLPGVSTTEFLAKVKEHNETLKTCVIENDSQIASDLFPILRSLYAARRVYLWLHKIFPGAKRVSAGSQPFGKVLQMRKAT